MLLLMVKINHHTDSNINQSSTFGLVIKIVYLIKSVVDSFSFDKQIVSVLQVMTYEEIDVQNIGLGCSQEQSILIFF